MTLKKLYIPMDLKEAYFLRARLEVEGIGVHIDGEATNTHSYLPQAINFEETLSLWVKEEVLELAQEIVRNYFAKPHLGEESWKCPQCAEELEAQFSDCWKCGARKPE